MDLVSRLIAGVLVAAASCAALADYAATATTGQGWRTGGAASTDSPTAAASCTAFRVQLRPSYPNDVVINGQCYMGFPPLSTSNFREVVNQAQVQVTTYSCPSGGTLAGTVCVQSADQAGCQAKAGQASGRWNFNTGLPESGPGPDPGGTYFACDPLGGDFTATQGCAMQIGPADFGWGDTGGTWWVRGPASYTGGTCNPQAQGTGGSATDTKGATPTTGTPGTGKDACPAGQVPGEVNGQTMCYTPGTDTPTTQKQDSSGSKTDGDGTKTDTTTSSTTKCDAGGTCTTTKSTTTTTTTAGGTPTSSTTTESSSCQAGQPGCVQGGGGGGGGQQGSAFGGSCTAGFTCTGDAATCAIARADWEQRCIIGKAFDVAAAEPNAQIALAAATGASAPAGHPRSSMTQIDVASQIDRSNPFGGGAVSDITIDGGTLVGNIVVPISSMQSVLELMGKLLVGLTALSCAFWLVKD